MSVLKIFKDYWNLEMCSTLLDCITCIAECLSTGSKRIDPDIMGIVRRLTSGQQASS